MLWGKWVISFLAAQNPKSGAERSQIKWQNFVSYVCECGLFSIEFACALGKIRA